MLGESDDLSLEHVDAMALDAVSKPACMKIPLAPHSPYLSNRLRLQLADGLACTSGLVPGWLLGVLRGAPSLLPASLRLVAQRAIGFGGQRYNESCAQFARDRIEVGSAQTEAIKGLYESRAELMRDRYNKLRGMMQDACRLSLRRLDEWVAIAEE